MLMRKTLIHLTIAALTLAIGWGGLVNAGRAESRDHLFIQVSSHGVLPEAVAHARKYAGSFPDSAVFESTNGIFAVVVGTTPRRKAKLLLSSLKLENRVPQDTIVTAGQRYAKMVWSMKSTSSGSAKSGSAKTALTMVYLGGFTTPDPDTPKTTLSSKSRHVEASLSTRCSMINLLTAANGGYSTDATRGDPDFILLEQFCLARLFAVTASAHLVRTQWGAIEHRIAETCDAFAEAMKGAVGQVDQQDMRTVVRNVQDLVAASVNARDDLIGTGKVCLGIGYKADKDRTALAAAVLLHALGEESYGEYVGHHLVHGVGVRANTALAAAWLASDAGAVQSGKKAIFASTAAERSELITAALGRLSGSKSK